MHPKTSVYVKNDDGQTKWTYFLIQDDIILFGESHCCYQK